MSAVTEGASQPTDIAGDPRSVSQLAGHLDGPFQRASGDLADELAEIRRSLHYAWCGGAGEAAVARVGALMRCADILRVVSRQLSDALDGFAAVLARTQADAARAREVARAGGLSVADKVIYAPPEQIDPSWRYPAAGMADVDDGEMLLKRQVAVDAWNEAVAIADGAFTDLNGGIDRLIEDLGKVNTLLAEIGEEVLKGMPAYLGKNVIPAVEQRIRVAGANAGATGLLAPERSKDLYEALFKQLALVEDADTAAKLGELARKSAKPIDALMTVQSIYERNADGQSIEQILIAEGSGWAAGVAATAATWGAAGSVLGSPGSPLASIVVGGFALVLGAGVGVWTSREVDAWYEDQEFEKLIEEASRDSR